MTTSNTISSDPHPDALYEVLADFARELPQEQALLGLGALVVQLAHEINDVPRLQHATHEVRLALGSYEASISRRGPLSVNTPPPLFNHPSGATEP